MRIGLVMMVKDEARRVDGALAPLVEHLDQVVVYDTGSTDGTLDRLRRLGVEPRHATLDPRRCESHADLRNRGLAALETDWCLTLDADERLEPAVLDHLRAAPPGPSVGGIALRWRNHLETGGSFDDYKVTLFRRGVRKCGLIHDNVQPELRRMGLVATWSDAGVLHHHPEAAKDGVKAARYAARLACAMRLEPDNPRYPWFAGYMALRQGALDDALRLLARAARSTHPRFPIERLNAHMAAAEAHAQRGDASGCRRWLDDGMRLLDEVGGDWELELNPHTGPWLQEARRHAEDGALEAVRTYRFAC